MQVRLLSYNVQSFRAGVEAAAEAVGGGADVALIQECGPRRKLHRFARALGLDVVSSHRPFGRVRNAVCYPADWRLVEVRSGRLSRQGRTLRRGFIAARLRAGRFRITAVSAHLGLAARERQRHVRELTDRLLGLDGVVFLGVDLNEAPDGPAARWMARRLYDAHAVRGLGTAETFPASAPTARIDYVFVSEGVRVLRCWVPGADAAARGSDHRPVLADVELSES